MIKSHDPIILLKYPTRAHTFPINEDIEENTYLKFLQKITQLGVNYSPPIKTSFLGNLCDRQRVNNCLGIKGFDCYCMQT